MRKNKEVMWFNMKGNCRAFTLIEMIIVISILVVLLSIAIPNYLLFSEKAEIDRVTKEIASMITQMYDKIESELAYYKYFVVINNWAKENDDGEKYLEVKFIKIEGSNQVKALKTLISRKVVLESNKVSTQRLTVITYDNRLRYCFSEADSETTIFLSSYSPTQGDTVIEIKGKRHSTFKRKIIIKEIPPGSVLIE